MKKRLIILAIIVLLLALATQPALADGNYTVRAGDTLAGIAGYYGLTASQLASANGLSWNSWVYTGQQLTIPGAASNSTSSGGSYTVAHGDTLYSIATKFGVSSSALQQANGISNANFVYVGQQLVIPGGGGGSQASAYTAAPVSTGGGGKWIDINLSTQTLTAYEGQTPVLQRYVSTGLYGTPTVVGRFQIQSKYASTLMTGGWGASYYYIPDVPYTMYFYKGYAIHGAYWHNNFGTPMSHGCVNMSVDDSAWLFNWAPMGTEVVTHY